MKPTIKMEKYQWINPEQHSIAVDDQKHPVVNEHGELIVLENETGKCISVPHTDEVLEIFGFTFTSLSANYSSSGSQKGSSPDPDTKPYVQVVTEPVEQEPLLWSMRTPCQKDIEATREMLALVASKRYQDMFNDQCTVKIRVWKRICEELMAKGYRIADSVNEGGIKCHQKWRNLEKSYRNYLISSTDPNSPAPKKPPPYFEALHEILKSKKKYANAAAYTQTVVVSSEDCLLELDTSDGGQQNMQRQQAHTPPHHLVDESDVIEEVEEVDEVDLTNDDHCYVVNFPGSVPKRMKLDPPFVVRLAAGTASEVQAGARGNARNPRNVQSEQQHQQQKQQQQLQQQQQQQQQLQHQQQQQQQQQQQNQHMTADGLEQVLENVVRMQRDMMNMHLKHFARLEMLMKDHSLQAKRLTDVMVQLLRTAQGAAGRGGKDCGKGSSDAD